MHLISNKIIKRSKIIINLTMFTGSTNIKDENKNHELFNRCILSVTWWRLIKKNHQHYISCLRFYLCFFYYYYKGFLIFTGSPITYSPDIFRQYKDILLEIGKQGPVLFHCATGRRAGELNKTNFKKKQHKIEKVRGYFEKFAYELCYAVIIRSTTNMWKFTKYLL